MGYNHEHPTMVGGSICKYDFLDCGPYVYVGMRNIRNDTNCKETSCGMDCNVSELHRIHSTVAGNLDSISYSTWFSLKFRLCCLLAYNCNYYYYYVITNNTVGLLIL